MPSRVVEAVPLLVLHGQREVGQLEMDELLDFMTPRTRIANFDASPAQDALFRFRSCRPEATEMCLFRLALLIPLPESLVKLHCSADFDVDYIGVVRVWSRDGLSTWAIVETCNLPSISKA